MALNVPGTETIRLIRDGERGGEGVWRCGGGGRLYNYRYTVTTRMTPALRWAAMRTIHRFNVSLIVMDKVTRQCSQTTTFSKRRESRSRIRAEALALTSLNYCWAKPAQ